MASLGGGKVVLFGGVNLFQQPHSDTWLFHRESTTTWKWTLLPTQMAPRDNHAMTSGLHNTIVLFGGQANYQFGTKVTPTTAKDTWILSDGCPIGYGGPGCAACPLGQYKNTTKAVGCTPCPDETTTATTGAFPVSRYVGLAAVRA